MTDFLAGVVPFHIELEFGVDLWSTADGKLFALDHQRCESCGISVSWEETKRDLDDDLAWPDEDTYLCKNCRDRTSR